MTLNPEKIFPRLQCLLFWVVDHLNIKLYKLLNSFLIDSRVRIVKFEIVEFSATKHNIAGYNIAKSNQLRVTNHIIYQYNDSAKWLVSLIRIG